MQGVTCHTLKTRHENEKKKKNALVCNLQHMSQHALSIGGVDQAQNFGGRPIANLIELLDERDGVRRRNIDAPRSRLLLLFRWRHNGVAIGVRGRRLRLVAADATAARLRCLGFATETSVAVQIREIGHALHLLGHRCHCLGLIGSGDKHVRRCLRPLRRHRVVTRRDRRRRCRCGASQRPECLLRAESHRRGVSPGALAIALECWRRRWRRRAAAVARSLRVHILVERTEGVYRARIVGAPSVWNANARRLMLLEVLRRRRSRWWWCRCWCRCCCLWSRRRRYLDSERRIG